MQLAGPTWQSSASPRSKQSGRRTLCAVLGFVSCIGWLASIFLRHNNGLQRLLRALTHMATGSHRGHA